MFVQRFFFTRLPSVCIGIAVKRFWVANIARIISHNLTRDIAKTCNWYMYGLKNRQLFEQLRLAADVQSN